MNFNKSNLFCLESISPTFYKHICANILAQIKSLTFTASTKRLRAKLLYKKAARKMLVKLTPADNHHLILLIRWSTKGEIFRFNYSFSNHCRIFFVEFVYSFVNYVYLPSLIQIFQSKPEEKQLDKQGS